MDLEFAQALALAAHGDVWLRDADDAPPPLPCVEIPSLACGKWPRFVLTGMKEPIAHAEGSWYRWLHDRGATRLRLIMASRPLPTAQGWMPGCWTATYRGRSMGTTPSVPDVSVAEATALLGATIAATLRDLREHGDEWCPPVLEGA